MQNAAPLDLEVVGDAHKTCAASRTNPPPRPLSAHVSRSRVVNLLTPPSPRSRPPRHRMRQQYCCFASQAGEQKGRRRDQWWPSAPFFWMCWSFDDFDPGCLSSARTRDQTNGSLIPGSNGSHRRSNGNSKGRVWRDVSRYVCIQPALPTTFHANTHCPDTHTHTRMNTLAFSPPTPLCAPEEFIYCSIGCTTEV